MTHDELSQTLYPIERDHPVFPLWALGQMLILFGILPRELRESTFRRLEALLQVHGVIR